jgi:predicted ATPase
VREPHPYAVTEQNFTIRVLQRQASNPHAVFLTTAREALSTHYEREPSDPRTGHALTLEIDRVAGRIDEALRAVAHGLAQARETAARFNEAELLRLRGDLLLLSASPTPDDAEQCFRQALEIARQQSARSLELRAVTSLGRLLQQQGKRDEARRHIEEVYSWFTEGFDTSDLKEAKALIDNLRASS